MSQTPLANNITLDFPEVTHDNGGGKQRVSSDTISMCGNGRARELPVGAVISFQTPDTAQASDATVDLLNQFGVNCGLTVEEEGQTITAKLPASDNVEKIAQNIASSLEQKLTL